MKILIGYLLLAHTLHTILHAFCFSLHVLALEQADIHFAEAVTKVNTYDLRISSFPLILYKADSFCVREVTTGAEDIAPVY